MGNRLKQLEYQKSSSISTGSGTPSNKDGANGSLSVRNVDGSVKLFAKINNAWNETTLGKNVEFTNIALKGFSAVDALNVSKGNVSIADNLTVTGTTALNDDITIPHGKKIIFDSTDTYIYANTDNPEDLVIGADADIVLEPDGNVGIGFATPEQALDVVSASSTFIRIDTSNASGDVGILFEGESTKKWRFMMDQSDTYCLNITDDDDNQGVQLQQNDGDGWGTLSDERWKSNWTEYENALDGINTLKAGKYKFKNLAKNNEIGSKWNSGLISQEVETILPDCVNTSSYEGIERKMLSYQAMIPYIVKAIQELSAKVSILESKV